MSLSEHDHVPHEQKFAYRGLDDKVVPKIDPIRSMVTTQLDLTKATIDTIYTVPTGKKFVLKTLIIFNDEGSATTYEIYDSATVVAGDKKMPTLTVGADVHVVRTKLTGVTFIDTVAVDPSAFTNGSRVTIGGYLIDA